MSIFERTIMLIGQDKFNILRSKRIAVVGLGGVGGACAEALYRSGVGSVVLLDHDCFEESNINRQLFAVRDTIGTSKCAAAKKRLESIHSMCEIILVDEFYSSETSELLFSTNPDYVIDAIDNVTSKLQLIEQSIKLNIPVISCMGTGNRLNPQKFKIGDISDTAGCGCGLARVMRRELKRRGITSLPVLYSEEPPNSQKAQRTPASISFCPPVAGYMLAAHAVNDILNNLA